MRNNMQTYEQRILPFGEAESTFSRADSRASHSRLLANDEEWKMTVTSGRKCCEQFARFVPDGSWAKTFSELLIGRTDWYSSKCALTWKLKATRSNRMYFLLAVSMHRTGDTELGLLPTIQTQGLKMCKRGKTVFYPNELLPTPMARDCFGVGCRDNLPNLFPGSPLNPRFVAEMMGFPPDWTELLFRSGEENRSKPTGMR